MVRRYYVPCFLVVVVVIIIIIIIIIIIYILWLFFPTLHNEDTTLSVVKFVFTGMF
jgi:hypothetical protein